jgi:hypothetical protein
MNASLSSALLTPLVKTLWVHTDASVKMVLVVTVSTVLVSTSYIFNMCMVETNPDPNHA